MRRSEILRKLAANRDDMIKLGVKTLAVFGSVARDEARQDSDVDILVEFRDKATFDGYMDLKFGSSLISVGNQASLYINSY